MSLIVLTVIYRVMLVLLLQSVNRDLDLSSNHSAPVHCPQLHLIGVRKNGRFRLLGPSTFEARVFRKY